jgi:cytochrome c oxidase assembly protein subunit 15
LSPNREVPFVAQSGLAASTDATGAPPNRPRADAQAESLRRFRLLAIATTALTLVLVAIGGAVRATDSGLACPDWPRCYGMWVPPADFNIWIEHTHRLVAGVVAVLIWALAGWALLRFRHRRDLVVPAVLAWLLVHVQALLGALVVWHLLKAELVTAHLGMAMAVIGCLVYLAVAAALPPRPRAFTPLTKALIGVAALVYAQILVGGHVTGIGASLAFTDFPTMGGRLVPEIRSEQEAFHVLHRALAFILFGASVWLAGVAVRYRRVVSDAGAWTAAQRWLVKLPMWGATLVVVQSALGVANLWTRTSYLTVIPHLAVASWIWAVFALAVALSLRLSLDPAHVHAAEQVARERA